MKKNETYIICTAPLDGNNKLSRGKKKRLKQIFYWEALS